MEHLKKFVDNTNEWDLYNGFFLNVQRCKTIF